MIVFLEEIPKLSGKMKATFRGDEETNCLYYDVENWQDSTKNGLYGGNYFQTMIPTRMNLTFNTKYDLDIENSRKIYKTLVTNGWTVNEQQ